MTEITSLAQVRFRAEEEEGGCPAILLDQEHTTDLSILRHGHLRLDLAPGTTRRKIENLATRLNDRIHALVYVGEDPDAPETWTGEATCAEILSVRPRRHRATRKCLPVGLGWTRSSVSRKRFSFN